MAISGTITLGTGTTSNMTSFDLYPCTSSSNSSCSGTAFDTNVSRASLIGGFQTNNIPDGTFYIKINSTNDGPCKDISPAIIELSGAPLQVSLTPTPTQTPTQTPSSTPPNTDIDPSYYYYAMGDCNDLKFSGTETTVFGFGQTLTLPVCMSNAQIAQWAQTANWAQQSLSIDYDSPCGFGDNYVSTTIARSATQITENSIYNVGGRCLLAIGVETQNVTGWTVNLDGQTSVGTGQAACSSCDPPFTGFTITGYSGVTCDTGENILAYTLFGSLVTGNTYGVQMYSGGTAVGDAICMTINENLGPQFVITDPEEGGLSGYQITDTGPFELGQQMFQGYDTCDACEGTVRKYMITGERCDTTGSVTIWSSTAPTVVSGDTISVSIAGTPVCFLVTQADQVTSVVYNDVGWTILETGCDCNGNSGGASVNVNNIVASPTASSNTGSECQSPMAEYYSETTISAMELIFRDSSNNQVTPNQAVEYRVNGGAWQSLTVTSAIETFSVTLVYGDNSACVGGGTYADTLDVKVGTLTILNYTAGQL